MRFDKLTTQFQTALADAQSLAVGHDSPTIEPQHLLEFGNGLGCVHNIDQVQLFRPHK